MKGSSNLRLVEFAVALGRHRNFARAAAAIRVTQPTFSRGIATLEKSLGVRLFDRSTRRVEPTSTGLAYLERAESLLDAARRLDGAIDAHRNLLSGQLTIGSGPYPLELCVIPAAAQLISRHPRMRIRIVEGQWRGLVQKLLSAAVDVVVMEASVLIDDHRVQVEALPRHGGVLVCKSGHPLAGRPRVSLQDIEPFPFVGVPMVREMRPRIGNATGRLDVDPVTGDLNPQVTVTTVATLRGIVKRTNGIGVCVRSQVEDDLCAGRLVVLETDFELPSTGYGIAWLGGRTPSPAALAFMQAMRESESAQEPPAKEASTPRPRSRC